MNYKFIGDYNIENIPSASISDLKAFLDTLEEFCVDIETTGLDPHKDKIIMLQVGNTDTQYIVDARCIDINFIIPYLVGSKKKLGANLKFEYKMFLGNLGCRMQNINDVIINEMIITCGLQRKGFSLEALAKKYLDVELPKTVRLEFTKIGDRPFEERHVRYGAGDVYYPQLINNLQQEILKKDDLLVVAKLEYNVVNVMGEMEFNGLPLNPSTWQTLAKKNKEFADLNLKNLDKYIIDNKIKNYYIASNLFSPEAKCLVKWTSPKEVAKVFNHLGIPTKILDKDKMKQVEEEYGIEMEFFKDSVGGPELERYAKEYPIIPMFLDYQKYNKAYTTFGDTWLEQNLNSVTGRIHSSFWPILNTGRSSSSNPNVQQIPCYKDADFRPSYQGHRTAFEAPKGYKFVVKDYSGQELRILAEMSNEQAMIDEFTKGTGDLHSLTASKVYSKIRGEEVIVNKKTNSGLRQNAKTLNFAISYGAGAYKIAKALKVSQEEAQEIIDGFFAAFPKLDAYFKEGHKFAQENGYIIIDPVTRRRSYFPFFKAFKELDSTIKQYLKDKKSNKDLKLDKTTWSNYFTYKGIMERASQNYRIQGLAASMTKIALVLFYNYLLKNNLFDKVEILLVLHDEVVVMAKDEYVELVDEQLTKCMLEAGRTFCKRIPMEVSGGPCTVWDH